MVDRVNSKCILFIAPHADDVEGLVFSTVLRAVQLGYDVHQCLACRDEYGVDRSDFQGRKLARIRMWEMYNVAKLYGIDAKGKPKVQLHWMPFIDGHVPFDSNSVHEYQKFIINLKPDIIFGPEPFCAPDYHPDHIATGRNYYFALKKMDPNLRPRVMVFFHTYRPTIFLQHGSLTEEHAAIGAHRSQFHAIELLGWKLGSWIFWRRSLRARWKLVDKIRPVSFNLNDNRPQFWGHVIWYYCFRFGRPKSGIYSKVPMETIIEDYTQNGWP
jgi:LmbE family N-acetylglucosaminyl deacetylase